MCPLKLFLFPETFTSTVGCFWLFASHLSMFIDSQRIFLRIIVILAVYFEINAALYLTVRHDIGIGLHIYVNEHISKMSDY